MNGKLLTNQIEEKKRYKNKEKLPINQLTKKKI